MNRDYVAELMSIGNEVDKFDNLFMERYSNLTVVLKQVSIIEERINLIDFEKLNNVEKIMYLYTSSNYRAILQYISCSEFEEFKKVSRILRQYNYYDEFVFKNFSSRIKNYREAIVLSEKEKDKINKLYMSQIYVNLANVYNEMGRTVESIEELKKVENLVEKFPMARANLAIKHHSLSIKVTDRSVMRFLIEKGIYELEDVLKNVSPDYMPDDIFKQFIEWKRYMVEINNNHLSDVKPWSKEFDVDDEYKSWASKRSLSLNYINVIYDYGNVDDIQMIDMGLGYFKDENSMEYYSWFNTIKQEYNMARYFLYKVDTSNHDNGVHESQRYNVLFNTLDYPAIGFRTELLKISLKTAYSVLDKIGLFCCKFHQQEIDANKVDFHKWYKKIELDIAIRSPFNALYWLSRDLDQKSGNFKNIRLLRNCIEHRFIRVLDFYDKSIDEELAEPNKYEYKISYSNLKKITYETIKLVRNAIIYMASGFNVEYNRVYYRDKNEVEFIPLYLSIYEDNWKN